ncbi:MAG: PD-(D/E)XK nuclease family protein [Paludibacteraceae bacterium]|nr:PD-(D/E)XK nuclease family protein [Paludibacteraceae bacterium]
MDSFLRHTAESILQSMDWSRLSRTTLVLPSHRAGLVLKDELLRLQQESHAQAVWAPAVQTLTQLQDALSPLYDEDELFTVVRLYRYYLTLNRQSSISADLMPLDLFYGWGRQMIADFTNIDASMPASEVPAFFANTVAAHELGEWQLDSETESRLRSLINPSSARPAAADSVKAQYELVWHRLYDFYCALHAEMEAERKGYPGMRQRAVIDHWEDESVQSQIAGRTYVFVGFNYLLPVERELMQRLRDAGQAYFYWDYVSNFETNEKAFSFARLNSGILGSVLPPRQWDAPRPVTVVSCTSREAQAQYVHSWLQANYTAPGQKVGVVICDESMLEPVIYTLPAITLPGETEPSPVNITKGFPLRNTAVYARVLAWLSDPARGAADEPVTPALIDDLIAQVLDTPTTQTTETTPTTEPTEALPPSPGLPWQELLILESEYQVRKVAHQMRLLITAGLGGQPFTLKLLRLLMRRTMESVSMPFHGEPVTDIQVMGVLETRMLDFDRLLLLNVEEGVIPQTRADISFIPYYLRKAYHMQTSDERATVYAYNFFRLLSRAGHATLLYASAEAAEGGKGMSRFVMQMLYSPAFDVTRRTLQEPSVLTSAERTIDAGTPSLLASLTPDKEGLLRRADGRPYRLSPSALNTYISCPRSFYLHYILGIQPKEEEEVLFAPNTLGSFVHHAMEYLYRTYLHCDNTSPVRVTPEQIEALRTDEAKIQAALDAAYEAMNAEAETPYIPDHHVGENIIIKGYVDNILSRDREDAKTGLQLYLLEQERTFPLTIDGVGTLLSGGTIDRLDIYGPPGNERLRVVDYKSGSYTDTTHLKKMSSSWEELMESEDKAYVRQTLIYSHAVLTHDRTGLPVEPNLFFCRRKLNEIVTTIDIGSETIHDYAAIREPFIEALQEKVRRLLTATEFPQCEPDKCPAFCPFYALCGRKPKEF